MAERRQVDFSRISDRVFEMAFEVMIRNRKTTGITVEVNEPIGGDWQMLQSTHPATKTTAFAASFEVPVTAGGETRLAYRVRVP